MKRRWQNLHTNSHFGRILRRKSDRRSSLSIRITANIFTDFLLSLFPHQFRVSLADRPFFVLGRRIELACVGAYFDEIKQSTVLLCWGFLLNHKRSVSDAVSQPRPGSLCCRSSFSWNLKQKSKQNKFLQLRRKRNKGEFYSNWQSSETVTRSHIAMEFVSR